MTSKVPAMSWSTPFDPPPPKGPPPKIPLPKPPGPAQMPTVQVSPLSNPPNNEYFSNVNFSTATPPRIPPKNNVRQPVLHRLSETDSVEEADLIDSTQGPRFRGASNESPVSPYTVLDHDTTLPVPTAFDLDKSSGTGRKGSGSSSSSIQRSRPRATHGNSLPYDEDGELVPLSRSTDKHKRILGIGDTKTPPIKHPERSDSPGTKLGGTRRKRSLPDIKERANSPLPGPDIVPFVYQDIEVHHGSDVLTSRMSGDSHHSKHRFIRILCPPCLPPSSICRPTPICGIDIAALV
jgi:hypothetical protein